jgi:DNA-binding PadR family transcriptional regulator
MRDKSSYTGGLSPEYALLGLLAQRPAHGYELHQRLITDLGQVWHLSLSQTYNILNRLEKKGLVSGSLQEQEKLPARRLFHITKTGTQLFKAWLDAPSGSSVRAIRVEFTTRLYFAHAIRPGLVEALIDAQVQEIRVGLDRLQKVLAGVPPEQVFNRLGLELRLRQLASILDWLGECRDVLVPPEGKEG